ncbi:MAG: response regulator [Methylobacteriaceae bacterium]|nr:response regulator [Methylobacteriaceae bacterium]
MSAAPAVFIVDDTPDDRSLVRREAEALFPGAAIHEAGSREEFEAALAAAPFDLVVTDLELKWGTGREVLQRVRDRAPGCPVVMFTDSGDEITAVELMKAGLDDYVVKSARQLPRLRASLKLAVESGRNRTALSQRERQLAAALDHQSTIVRELHHRVKNNLQTITSLLQLRARARGGEIAAELQDLAGRMRALGQVQARIYETDALDRVEFGKALSDMAEGLVGLYQDRHVALRRELDGPLELDVARAMPLGLLCYEIMLNAMKHAWPEGRAGRLTVGLTVPDGGAPEVLIADDGIGYVETAIVKGIGSRLARSLAQEASVTIETRSDPQGGTRVRLRLRWP